MRAPVAKDRLTGLSRRLALARDLPRCLDGFQGVVVDPDVPPPRLVGIPGVVHNQVEQWFSSDVLSREQNRSTGSTRRARRHHPPGRASNLHDVATRAQSEISVTAGFTEL